VVGRRLAVTSLTDDDLYLRGTDTVVASWEAYARGAPGARVQRWRGVATAVFPNEPERSIYNNAILARDLAPAARADGLDAMEAAYARAEISHFAAWVHESEHEMIRDLERRGYTLAETTRAMGMALDDLRPPRPALEVERIEWSEWVAIFGLPAGLLSGLDPDAFQLLSTRLGGEPVASAIAFDHERDCGIYNVGTLEHARKRGLGTALTAVQLHDARARGCHTATLQATEMAERMYGAVGFRDLGQIREYAPPSS
jgi:ribosomal protein S18 acetylase RimI-like enzyme